MKQKNKWCWINIVIKYLKRAFCESLCVAGEKFMLDFKCTLKKIKHFPPYTKWKFKYHHYFLSMFLFFSIYEPSEFQTFAKNFLFCFVICLMFDFTAVTKLKDYKETFLILKKLKMKIPKVQRYKNWVSNVVCLKCVTSTKSFLYIILHSILCKSSSIINKKTLLLTITNTPKT